MAQQTPESATDGRETRMRRVRRLLRDAAAGRGGSLIAEGERGSGKTSLLSQIAEEARRLRLRVFTGAADELGRSVPLGALRNCLADARPGPSGPGPAGAEPPDGGTDPAAPLLALVDRLCRAAPVVLVLDDLQWADGPSLRAWRRLTDTAGQRPLLLAAAIRNAPGGTPPPSARDLLDSGATHLPLLPLGLRETARLAERILGVPPGPRLLRHLGHAGGNPRHLRELLAATATGDTLRITGDTAELTTGPTETGNETGTGAWLPPALAAALTDRLAHLAPPTLTALRTAALLGPAFRLRDLAAVMERPGASLRPAVDEALADGVLAETAGGTLRFRHGTTHAALRAGIPGPLRAALHTRAARTLAAARAPAPLVAAQLLPATGLRADDDWTARWLESHAAEVLRHDPRAAADLVARVRDRIPPDRPGLLETAAAGAYLLRRPDAADQARDLHDRTTDPVRRARLSHLTTLALLQEGRLKEAHATVDETLAAGAGHPRWTTRSLALRALLLSSGHRFEEAGTLADQVLEQALRLRAPVPEAYARSVRARLLDRAGDREGAIAETVRAREAARRRDVTRDLVLTRTLHGARLLDALGHTTEARTWLAEAEALADGTGSGVRRSWAHTVSAWFHYRAGRWDEALAGLDLAHHHPEPWLPVTPHGLATVILTGRDQRDEARSRLAADENTAGRAPAFLPLARALLAERDGDPEAALALLGETLAPGSAEEWTHRGAWLPETVRLALALQDTARARAATETADAEAAAAPADLGRRAVALRCRGLLHTDPAPLRTAAAHYRRHGAPTGLGATHEDLAAVLALRGDTDGARTALARAVDIHQQLGARWYTARADARLRALGVRRGGRGAADRPKTGWDALTPAELKVALLVAEGRTNPQVATELLLSPRTVQTHVSHILTKLGAHSRTAIGSEAGRRRALGGGPARGPAPDHDDTGKETGHRGDGQRRRPVDRQDIRDPAAHRAPQGSGRREGRLDTDRGRTGHREDRPPPPGGP
ncbi:ATP-binding protein [Streptomyces sp. NPDC001889]